MKILCTFSFSGQIITKDQIKATINIVKNKNANFQKETINSSMFARYNDDGIYRATVKRQKPKIGRLFETPLFKIFL